MRCVEFELLRLNLVRRLFLCDLHELRLIQRNTNFVHLRMTPGEKSKSGSIPRRGAKIAEADQQIYADGREGGGRAGRAVSEVILEGVKNAQRGKSG